MLERQLGKLCRKAAMQLVEGDVKRVDITDKNLRDLLGVEQYTDPSTATGTRWAWSTAWPGPR